MLTNVHPMTVFWIGEPYCLPLQLWKYRARGWCSLNGRLFFISHKPWDLSVVIIGLALGYSNFSRQTVIRLAVGYTLVLIPIQLLNAAERTELAVAGSCSAV